MTTGTYWDQDSTWIHLRDFQMPVSSVHPWSSCISNTLTQSPLLGKPAHKILFKCLFSENKLCKDLSMPHRWRGTVEAELANCTCQAFQLCLGRVIRRGPPLTLLRTHSRQTGSTTDVEHECIFLPLKVPSFCKLLFSVVFTRFILPVHFIKTLE